MKSIEQPQQSRGVSPVIGVILMIAITVILSAVIGVFVLGLSDAVQETPPTVQLELEKSHDNVSVTHMSGETIDAHRLVMISPSGAEIDFADTEQWAGTGWDQSVRAGDRAMTVNGFEPGEYRIVWQTDGASSVLKSKRLE